MMDSLTRTSMSRASAWGESPAPSSSGRHPTQRYPSRPCPAASESGLYRHPVADTPFSIDPFAVRGGRFIVCAVVFFDEAPSWNGCPGDEFDKRKTKLSTKQKRLRQTSFMQLRNYETKQTTTYPNVEPEGSWVHLTSFSIQ